MKKGWRMQLVSSALWTLAAVVSVLVAVLLGGCDQKPKADCMGYTWQKVAPVASTITIRHEPDWRKYPGLCRNFNTQGCAERTINPVGGVHVDILLKDPPDSYTGTCNTLTHEIRHALGEVHVEPHSYTPRDYTR